jgi:uncharacterized delta-60 repeat protein
MKTRIESARPAFGRFGSWRAVVVTMAGVLMVANGSLFRVQAQFLDPSFNPGAGPNSNVNEIVVDSAGRVLIGGDFTSCSGATRTGIARYNPDGSLDAFAPALTMPASKKTGSSMPGSASQIVLQPDGKILLVGGFSQVNGIARAGFARVTDNGSLDRSFPAAPEAVAGTSQIALLLDGRIFVTRVFRDANNVLQYRHLMLLPDGSPDPSFKVGSTDDYVFTAVGLPSGRVLLAGWFNSVDGVPCDSLVRLNADGTLDTSFHAPAISTVTRLVLEPISWDPALPEEQRFKILASTSWNPLRRLSFDGDIETVFESAPYAMCYSQVVGHDGSVLAAAEDYNAVGDLYISTLHHYLPNGTIDWRFWPVYVTAPFGGGFRIAAGADGNVYLGGSYTGLNGQDCPRLVRVNSTFVPEGYTAIYLGNAVTVKARSGSGWIATVRLAVCTINGEPVRGATIRGYWLSYTSSLTGGRQGPPLMSISGADGQCVVQRTCVSKDAAVEFYITGVVPPQGSGYFYNPILDLHRPPFTSINSVRIYAP